MPFRHQSTQSKRPLSSLLTKEYELKDEINKLKSEINELKTDNFPSSNRAHKYEIDINNLNQNFVDLTTKRKLIREKEHFFDDENQKNKFNNTSNANKRSQFLTSMETFINNEEDVLKERPFNNITHHIKLTNFNKSEEKRRPHSGNSANLKRSSSLHSQACSLLIKLNLSETGK